MLTFTSGSTGSGTISQNLHNRFSNFFSYRLLGHCRLAFGSPDPMLAFTYGSTGSGTIYQELHNIFQTFFSVIDLLGNETLIPSKTTRNSFVFVMDKHLMSSYYYYYSLYLNSHRFNQGILLKPKVILGLV